MNVWRLFVVLFSVAAIMGGVSAVFFAHYTVLDRWVIPYNFTVASSGIGIITDQTIPLPMGEAMAGSTLERFIYLGNPRGYGVVGRISAEGPTASWVETSREYRVAPGQTERVSLKIVIPEGTPVGDYQGVFVLLVNREWQGI